MPSIQILIVEKVGTLKTLKLNSFLEEDLYKKAGFKTNEGFKLATTWSDIKLTDGKMYSVSLYGKQSGRAGQENKYDFPPPVDSTLFFGNCVLVLKVGELEKEKEENLTLDLWNKIYENLFGGFEDIGSNDSEEESEDDSEDDLVPRTKSGYAKDGFVVEDSEDDLVPRTKSGYAKDGFVVEDSEDSEELELDESDESEEEELEVVPIVAKKGKKETKKKDTKKKEDKKEDNPSTATIKKNVGSRKKTVFDKIETVIIDTIVAEDITANFLDCSDELLEEAYL